MCFDRPLQLRALVTWQPENRQVTPGLSDLDSAGATTPEWRLTGFINYNVTDRFKDIELRLQKRVVGQTNAVRAVAQPECHGPMRAVAVEQPKVERRRCCLGRRSR